jgi:hypothetical protein
MQLGVKCKKINHVAFSSDGSEALINYQRENLYLINMKQGNFTQNLFYFYFTSMEKFMTIYFYTTIRDSEELG